MPLSTILLYAASTMMSVLLLTLIASTGNARGLCSSVLWISTDLAVTIIGTVLSRQADYAGHIFPVLFRIHCAAFLLCLAWMIRDAVAERHPLSLTFAAGFGVYGLCRVGEYAIFRMNRSHSMGTALWWIDTLVFFIIAGVLMFALFHPIDPEPAQQPRATEISAGAMPALARTVLHG